MPPRSGKRGFALGAANSKRAYPESKLNTATPPSIGQVFMRISESLNTLLLSKEPDLLFPANAQKPPEFHSA